MGASRPEIVFVSTYAFDEPVVRNRLTPFIDLALEQEMGVTVVNPAGGVYHNASHPSFNHLALNAPQANRGGFVIRTLREIALAWRVLRAAPRDSDYMVITVPSMFLLFLFWRARAGRRLLDVRDMTWEYLGDHFLFRRWSKHFFRFLARRSMPQFDLIAVTCNAEQAALSQWLGLPEGRFIVASNGISRAQYEALAPVAVSKERISDRLRVLYVGNVGLAQDLATLLEAARRLPDVDVDIVGAGSDFERIRTLARKLPNVQLNGRLSWTDIPEHYERADILYAQLTPDYARAMPSKLYEYLATGKPVIYGGCGQAPAFLDQFDHVMTIEPDNVDALVEAIQGARGLRICGGINRAGREFVAQQCIREDAVKRVYRKFLKL